MSLKKTKDIVKEFSAKPNAMVLFFDEGRFGLKPTIARLWAKRGVRIIAKVQHRYKNFYLYSGVSPQSGESFSLFLPWVNTEMMSIYLKELSLAHKDKSLLLIMDQAGWHKSNNLQIPKNINLIFLPPYSPELNPVEKLWQWTRRHICRNRLFESDEHLMDAISEHLNSLSVEKLSQLCACSYL